MSRAAGGGGGGGGSFDSVATALPFLRRSASSFGFMGESGGKGGRKEFLWFVFSDFLFEILMGGKKEEAAVSL